MKNHAIALLVLLGLASPSKAAVLTSLVYGTTPTNAHKFTCKTYNNLTTDYQVYEGFAMRCQITQHCSGITEEFKPTEVFIFIGPQLKTMQGNWTHGCPENSYYTVESFHIIDWKPSSGRQDELRIHKITKLLQCLA